MCIIRKNESKRSQDCKKTLTSPFQYDKINMLGNAKNEKKSIPH